MVFREPDPLPTRGLHTNAGPEVRPALRDTGPTVRDKGEGRQNRGLGRDGTGLLLPSPLPLP